MIDHFFTCYLGPYLGWVGPLLEGLVAYYTNTYHVTWPIAFDLIQSSAAAFAFSFSTWAFSLAFSAKAPPSSAAH